MSHVNVCICLCLGYSGEKGCDPYAFNPLAVESRHQIRMPVIARVKLALVGCSETPEPQCDLGWELLLMFLELSV